MDLEQLKAQWKSVDFATDNMDETNRELTRQIAVNHASSVRQRLAKIHKHTAIVGFMLPVLAPLLYLVFNMPMWISLLYAVFGLLMSGLNLAFVRYVLGCDYTSLPIVEACAHAVKVDAWRRWLLVIGWVGMIVVIVPLLTVIYQAEGSDVFVGGIVGLVIGLAIALPRCYRSYKLTKELNEILKSAVE
jgi:Na+/melibiose symporter-like transporter